MGMRVLKADEPEDRSVWLELWDLTAEREPWSHPEYLDLFREAEADDHILLVGPGNSQRILWPLVSRRTGKSSVPRDLTSPLAFGGLWSGDGPIEPRAIDQFWHGFFKWAENAGIVSVFTRLNVEEDVSLASGLQVRKATPYVVRRLQCTSSELWSDYAHKVRKNVKRSRSLDVQLEVDAAGETAEEFVDVYRHTMRRRGVERLAFEGTQLRRAMRLMAGGLVLFNARDMAGRLVSSELAAVSTSRIYSLLGGTYPEAFDLRPNDAIKHAICEWGISEKKASYVLGGGAAPNDGIFAYKAAFAPDSTVWHYTAQAILDETVYSDLVTARKIVVDQSGSGPGDYFPAYRVTPD